MDTGTLMAIFLCVFLCIAFLSIIIRAASASGRRRSSGFERGLRYGSDFAEINDSSEPHKHASHHTIHHQGGGMNGSHHHNTSHHGGFSGGGHHGGSFSSGDSGSSHHSSGFSGGDFGGGGHHGH